MVLAVAVVAVVEAEADEAVGVGEVVVDASAEDTVVVAVVAVEDTVAGEDATGGEWMRLIAMIRLILRNWSQFGPVL
jgi:hypothetical protein